MIWLALKKWWFFKRCIWKYDLQRIWNDAWTTAILLKIKTDHFSLDVFENIIYILCHFTEWLIWAHGKKISDNGRRVQEVTDNGRHYSLYNMTGLWHCLWLLPRCCSLNLRQHKSGSLTSCHRVPVLWPEVHYLGLAEVVHGQRFPTHKALHLQLAP